MTQPPTFATSEDFVDHLLAAHCHDMRMLQGPDNYDWGRFSGDGIDRFDQTYDHLHIATFKALMRHSNEFYSVYNLLADDHSKTLFLELIRYRLAGHKHVRLSTNNDLYHQRKAAIAATPYELTQHGGYTLRHYTLPFREQTLTFDGLACDWPFYHPQYFLERGAVRIQPDSSDCVIDAGCCLGETTLAFAAAAGLSGQVHAFDILPQHLQILHHNVAANLGAALAPITSYLTALSDHNAAASNAALPDRLNPAFKITDAANAVTVSKLDDWAEANGSGKIDFIKMDVEGSETAALRGAEQTLRRWRPKLEICLYHDIQHFFQIPLWLDSLQCGYKFYLGHYTIHAGETVLYASTP